MQFVIEPIFFSSTQKGCIVFLYFCKKIDYEYKSQSLSRRMIMETRVLREITPLGDNDFMYVADRRKKEFDFPIH